MIRIVCPEYTNSKEKRIEKLFDDIEKWCRSDKLQKLFNEFGAKINCDSLEKGTLIDNLHSAAQMWDFRKGKERWDVVDGELVLRKAELIYEVATELGLTDISEPIDKPDYILPLGGARLANLLRPQFAKETIDNGNWEGVNIVALSGTRPISEIELPYINQYAVGAKTEYEAICKGIEKAFNTGSEYKEERNNDDNINSCYAIRTYCSSYKKGEVASIAAPSSDPENRRANSADTFKFFLEKYRIGKGKKLLLITSNIYVPFQLLKFMDLAIEKDFEVDCIGSDNSPDGLKFSTPSNYLQEIKGTIDAIKQLKDKYL